MIFFKLSVALILPIDSQCVYCFPGLLDTKDTTMNIINMIPPLKYLQSSRGGFFTSSYSRVWKVY